jgi:dipeptidase E
LFPVLMCPHYDVEEDRKPELKRLMTRTKEIGVAVDNCCAVVIVDNTYKLVSSRKTAQAYKVLYKDGTYIHKRIDEKMKFSSINELLVR